MVTLILANFWVRTFPNKYADCNCKLKSLTVFKKYKKLKINHSFSKELCTEEVIMSSTNKIINTKYLLR